MMRAAVLAVLLVPAAVIGLDTPLVMADNHLPEGAFVTTWKATNTDKTIKIPVGGQTGNYTVDWGDGTDSTTHVSDATHEYITAGDYTVSISGDFKRIFLNGVQSSSVSEVKNAKQLRSIEQWGDMEWSSMTSAFRGASKMVYNAVDTPDLSNVKSMEYMFHVARAFNGNLSSWNVSQVTNMGFMYQNARAFNGDISSWNVSAVTDMNNMFNGASSFNQTLNDWDVSKVTNTYSMFEYASDFNGDISSWNVSAVTDMNNMFNDASSFNQTLNDWDVLKVTDMSYMFSGAEVFNQPLNDWNVSAVTDMSSMFDGAYYFNGDISRWNVSAVTDMNNMFNGVSSFNQTLNDWDVLKVTDMSYMFSGAEVFNQPLNDWDVSKVNNTYGMFEFASSFNGNISSWNVSAVTNMNSMFSDASSFNQTLNNWNVSKVTDMSYMFLGAAAFNQPLNGWDVSKVTNTVSMFEYASSFNQPLNDWDVSKVTDMYYMFSSAAAFNQPLNNWNVSKVTDMDNMFSGAEDFNQPLNNWNVSAVTSMRNMFSGASSFEQNLGKWYVVPADTVYNTSDEMSLVITTIAAQNSVLDGHSHYYGIGTGGNSALFSMTGSNLVFKVTPSAETYKVNVTAPEGDFGTNNHRVLDITVEGQDDSTVSADAFVTTWNVTASPYIISIPVEVHAGGMLTIDWGDNVITTVTTNGTQSHTYSASDEYQVSMTGDLSRIILGDVGSTAGKLASIDQWGDIEWSSMKSAFPYTHNMKYNASDVPNLSGVSNMGNMFTRALKFDGDLSEWNVSAVTDMHSVFTHASSFNGNVSTWNVSAVTDMGYMFNGASVFNGDISSWNVSAVTNMRDMFDSASVFNGDISRWNVSAVTNMAEMFHIASDFNGDISGWNVSAVTDMNRMFSGASVFNGDISGWNVSAVTDMHRMFSQAFAFNGDISSWNVSSVTDMSHMFSRATSFDSDISGWNVSSVKDTSYMFSSARSFNQPLNSWNVSAVTAMTDMFSDSRSFNQNLGEWYIVPAEIAYDITDASLNVTVISAQNSILDDHNPTYGIDPDNSHDSGLFNMTGNNLMFKSTPLSARVYTVNVTAPGGDFGTNNHHVFDITVTGEDRPLLVDVGPDQRVLDESEVTLSGTVSDSDSTDLTYLWTQNPGSPAVTLANSDKLTSTFTAPDVSSDVDLIFTLTVDDGTDTVTDTVTVTVHDAEADFVTTWSDITIGINIPIRSSVGSFTVDWGDGKITEYDAIATNAGLAHLYDIPGTHTIRISGNFSGIFLGDDTNTAGKLQSIDQWGDIKWTTMAGAFYHAVNMIYNAIDVPDLSSVTDMSFMFARTGFSSGDLSGWNVSGVTDMRNMFLSSSYTGDLSGWDVSSVTDMQNMFSRASSFDSDLSDWDVSAVNSMNSMFFRASSFDSDLSGWNVSSVTSMQNMFLYATSFNSDLSGWNVSAVNNMDDMFSGATSFEQNLGPWYIVLDSDTISYPTQTLEIMAQNLFLGRQSPMYGLVMGDDPDLFVVDAAARTLGLNPNSDPSPPPNGIYQVNVTSTGSFGTANHRMVEVTVDNADPAVMPPTFYSSVFNNVTGVLTIVFSETIDAANVVPAKIHIRESGNYTDGITLSAGEFVTVANDTAISFILIASHLTTVTGLTTPELTIEPGAVQDMFGNLIDGTFDVSTASYNGDDEKFSVLSQDTEPYGMAFSIDGIKMFVVGDFENDINQYTLSIAFDVSTASHDGNDKKFSVSSQDTTPRGMAFSNDGTKMFVVGDTNNNINQYALSIPFDISTANFTTAISTPDNYPKGMAFSNDGTKMFVVSSVKSAINQYTLSIPFDLFNATLVASPFDISEQDTYPKDMAFSNDGTKMFVIGARANTINQYTLSAPFDLFNATYDGDGERFSVSSQDDDPAGMTFSNDGAKMFVVGNHGNDVNEYALSSVYPITLTDEAAIDSTPPVIVLTGSDTITITVGGTYDEQGATCNDVVDGARDVIMGGDAVDVDAVGTYVITYDCKDSSDNAAVQVTRTVTVEAAIDSTPPVIVLTGSDTITITVGGTYDEQGATCNDVVDGARDVIMGGDAVDVDAVGTYVITYDCKDSSDNAAVQVTRTVTVEAAIDNTPPVIVLTGSDTITIIVGGTYDEQGATCNDVVDGARDVIMGGDAVDVDAVGTYVITYDCKDSSDNAAVQVTRTVTVEAAIDSTPPVIVLTGSDTITITVGGTYDEQGATCNDVVDGARDVIMGGDAVDVDAVGTYVITYDCKDSSDNAAVQVTRTVTVEAAIDSTPPVIVLTGSDTITITVGGTYDEQGATCNDVVDGARDVIMGGDAVDVDAVGTYVITYDCKDSSDNAAVQVTRTVTVEAAIDSTPPVIVLTGSDTITITVGGTYDEQGATCNDVVDGARDVIMGGDAVDVDAVGTYVITYDCKDSSDNAAVQVTRTVTVEAAIDNTPPVIVLTGSDTITITVGGTYDEQGATCNDVVDGARDVIMGGDAVDVDAVGTYVITYDCKDSSDNAAVQVTRTVTVEAAIDSTPPVIVLTGSDTITITVGGTYDEQGATCNDVVDGARDVIMGGDAVDVDAVGTYVITYDCKDSSDNAAVQVTRTVTVEAAIDSTPPVIVLTGSDTITITVGGTYDEQGATCNDVVDGARDVIMGGDAVDVDAVGTYVITYDCKDSSDNAAVQVTRTVTVEAAIDNTPPVIVLTGSDTITIIVGGTYDEQGATCNDVVDGARDVIMGGDAVDVDAVGTYVITYDCKDSSDNAAVQVTRTVTVEAAIDSTPPVIVLTGSDTITITVGGTYDEQGATCNDVVDGARDVIMGGDAVDVDAVGTYVITYDCKDSSDNAAVQVTRTVTVEAAIDSTPPVIVLTGSDTITITVGGTYDEQGATCNDVVDGARDVIMGGDAVDVDAVGTYVITYDCKDSSDNAAVQVTRTVTVEAAIDSTPPVIVLTGSDTITITVGGTYDEQGATCNDVVDGARDVIMGGDAVDVDAVGTYVITYDCKDSSDNAAVQVTRTVTVMASNTAPEARAGPNLQVDEGESIRLQGSGYDIDNDFLTYSWSQDSRLSFDNRTSATPTVTASSVTIDTPITLTLTVDDGTISNEDTMVLTILEVTEENLRPKVDVGPNQTVKEGTTVSMPWTANDPDGDALTYLWSQSPDQPAIFLESPGQSPTTFTTPQVDDDTEFTFTLTVTAGPHNADDSLTITVKNNHSPTVDAGNNRTVNEGVPVTLSGIARDLDDDPLTYEWTIVSGPAPTDLTGDNMESLQFTAPGVAPDEDIVFRFTATDDSGEFAEDTVTITVRDVPITVSSATYNPGSGTLLITFNQDIATVDYSRLHVRSANSDIGGITLFNAVSKDISSNDRTITVVLDSDMREMYTDLTSPHLVVEDGAITDIDGDQTTDVPNQPLRDASSNKRSSSPPPVVHLSALAQARIVDIPAHIAEQISSRDDSDPLEPLMLDDTFDFPLVINNYGYLLDDVTNTLVPQIVTVGDDDPTVITFTVYTQKDLAHFTLYLNLSDENTDYTDSDTYITYKNDGTAVVTDPHGYIADATITVTQEDDSMPEKKTVSITLYFDEPMGPTNMVAYMWNTDRKAAFIKIIDAFEVTAVLPESVIQTADPEPLEPNSELPADPEPSSELPADPEPVSTDTLGPDDYDDAQVLHIIRMWSGFESEFITDEQMLASLGLDYPDADIPDWVMTQLGVLAAKGDVTVDEFMLALQYVLENL